MTGTPEAPIGDFPLGPDPLICTLERTLFFDAIWEQIRRRSFWGILTRRRRRNTSPLLIRWCRYLYGWQRASLLHRWFVPLENTLLWYLQNTRYRRPSRSSPTWPRAAGVTKERHRLSSSERTERSQPQQHEWTPGLHPCPRKLPGECPHIALSPSRREERASPTRRTKPGDADQGEQGKWPYPLGPRHSFSSRRHTSPLDPYSPAAAAWASPLPPTHSQTGPTMAGHQWPASPTAGATTRLLRRSSISQAKAPTSPSHPRSAGTPRGDTTGPSPAVEAAKTSPPSASVTSSSPDRHSDVYPKSPPGRSRGSHSPARSPKRKETGQSPHPTPASAEEWQHNLQKLISQAISGNQRSADQLIRTLIFMERMFSGKARRHRRTRNALDSQGHTSRRTPPIARRNRSSQSLNLKQPLGEEQVREPRRVLPPGSHGGFEHDRNSGHEHGRSGDRPAGCSWSDDRNGQEAEGHAAENRPMGPPRRISCHVNVVEPVTSVRPFHSDRLSVELHHPERDHPWSEALSRIGNPAGRRPAGNRRRRGQPPWQRQGNPGSRWNRPTPPNRWVRQVHPSGEEGESAEARRSWRDRHSEARRTWDRQRRDRCSGNRYPWNRLASPRAGHDPSVMTSSCQNIRCVRRWEVAREVGSVTLRCPIPSACLRSWCSVASDRRGRRWGADHRQRVGPARAPPRESGPKGGSLDAAASGAPHGESLRADGCARSPPDLCGQWPRASAKMTRIGCDGNDDAKGRWSHEDS